MISVADMNKLEDLSERHGVSKLHLMENAGRGIADVIAKKYDEKLKNKKLLIICYHGNNGGDGFVAARYLSEITGVDILFIGEESKLKGEAEKNYLKIQDNQKITFTSDFEDLNFGDYDIIIDAMLGTGSKGRLKEPISAVVDKINKTKAYKIAVDIPTGMDPDTGKIADKAVKADLILTFHDLKKGLEDYQHKTQVIDIGIPQEAIKCQSFPSSL